MTHVVNLDRPAPEAATIPEGTRRIVNGDERVFYDGYWIKTYTVPADTLEAKKRLIEALTRRLEAVERRNHFWEERIAALEEMSAREDTSLTSLNATLARWLDPSDCPQSSDTSPDSSGT